MAELNYISPIQNWASFKNPANLVNILDYYFNQDEIDQQLEAIKQGLA